ncbi:hypothetical protein GCM10027456_78450 [Kineosporia babensis]
MFGLWSSEMAFVSGLLDDLGSPSNVSVFDLIRILGDAVAPDGERADR